MNDVVVDWGQDGSSYAVYPNGDYPVRIVSWEYCKSKRDTDQVRWHAEIQQPEQYRGKSIIDHTALTAAAKWRLVNLVQACGIKATGKMAIKTPAFEQVLNACKGRTSIWVVEENEQYHNNKITDYFPDPANSVVEIDVLAGDKQCPF